jgi:hypothetical protein
LSNSRELSKIFTADTTVTTHSELITAVAAASAYVMQEAMEYTDNATPDLTPAIQAASAAAVAYTDQELSNIDLTSTIITASAAATASAAIYTDSQISTIDFTQFSNPIFNSPVTINDDLEITGNLTISGSATFVNSNSLEINDPIIYLAVSPCASYTTDLLDVGFTSAYGPHPSGGSAHYHRGLIFDHLDDKWKLFSNAPHPINNDFDLTEAVYDTLKVENIEGDLVGTSSSANYVSYTGVVGLETNYLTQSSASTTYLTQSSASTTYLTQSSASTQYEKLIPYSTSTPTSPVTGDMWLDSNSTPPALKVYDGSNWVQLGAAVDDSQAIIASRMFTQ